MAMLAMFCLQGYAQAGAYPVPDIVLCNFFNFDLTQQDSITLGGQDPDIFMVSYHETYADAENNVNAIANPTSYAAVSNPQLMYLRVTSAIDDTYAIQTFTISSIESSTDYYPDVAACNSYTLPPLSPGYSYYTQANGQGSVIEAGTVLTQSQIIYTYAAGSECSISSQFKVSIIDPDNPPVLEPLVGCDEDNDGVTEFITEYLWGQIYNLFGFTGNNEISVHGTEADAQSDVNPVYQVLIDEDDAGPAMVYLRYEAENCTVIFPVELITLPCGDVYNNTISGYVTMDIDNNGCTLNDAPAASYIVYYTSGNNTVYTYTNAQGFYFLTNVPDGPVTVYANSQAQNTAVVTPGNYNLTMPGNIENINFCLTPPSPFTDVSVSLYPLTPAVPGFAATYILHYNNVGTVTVSGEVTFEFDAAHLTFTSSTIPVTVTGNTLTFSYTDLQPYESGYTYITFVLAQPPALQSGSTLTFTAEITSVATDIDMTSNTFELTDVVVNSYDPNDITVQEGEYITEEQADGYLHYKVRFQNEGDFMATNVRVETALDANLDWATFEPLTASHSYQAYRSGDGIEFAFNNIQLTYADDDEAASQGYIIYRIKPKADVSLGDVMTATADIYFDFNEAIVTNTATTTIVAPTAGIKNQEAGAFTLYPNPAKDEVKIHIQNITDSATVTITDVLGKVVLTSKLTATENSLAIGSLKSGVYFVTVATSGMQSTKKLVVK